MDHIELSKPVFENPFSRSLNRTSISILNQNPPFSLKPQYNFIYSLFCDSAITTLRITSPPQQRFSMGNFDMLPSDVILEILSRVPAETVLECKLVSKPWRDLVRRPTFSQIHLNHLNHLDSSQDSGKLNCIFYTRGTNKIPFYYTEYDEDLSCFTRTIRINFKHPFEDCHILGSCNGLICFSGWAENVHLPYEPTYICNPITREYIVLQKYERNGFLTGFGYSSSTNEYKVVRVCNSGRGPISRIVQVYTLGSALGWRNVTLKDIDLTIYQYGVFLDGAIHWVDAQGTILAFNLADEVFRELSSPPSDLPFPIIMLHALGNFLCASIDYLGGFDMWVLKKSKNNLDVKWSKEFSINFNVNPISFTKSGGLLCYDQRDKNVYRYKDSSARELVDFTKNFNDGVRHKNTLVSLKALGEEDTKLMEPTEQQKERDL